MFQVEVVNLIWHQILVTNLQGKYVQQLDGRINKQILGVKGWLTQIYFNRQVIQW